MLARWTLTAAYFKAAGVRLALCNEPHLSELRALAKTDEEAWSGPIDLDFGLARSSGVPSQLPSD